MHVTLRRHDHYTDLIQTGRGPLWSSGGLLPPFQVIYIPRGVLFVLTFFQANLHYCLVRVLLHFLTPSVDSSRSAWGFPIVRRNATR